MECSNTSSKFISDLRSLLKTVSFCTYNYTLIVCDIEEIELDEYCLSLALDNYVFKGIYASKRFYIGEKIQNSLIYITKKDLDIKIYLSTYSMVMSDISLDIRNTEDAINNCIIKEKPNLNNFTEINLKPENLVEFFGSKEQYNDDIFQIERIDKDIIQLISLYDSKQFLIKSHLLKNIVPKEKEFLFIKNYLLNRNEIEGNNLTIIKKASDYDIFHKLELDNQKNQEELKKDYYEILPIDKEEKEEIKCLVCKIVLKEQKDKIIKAIDLSNRIIDLDFDLFQSLDLFSLLLITNCTICKSNNDIFSYSLQLNKNSIQYNTNTLYFDKRISLNNYTLINVQFPDFKHDNNYYDKIIFSNIEFKISKKINIFSFRFDNEKYNEIVPYSLKCKNSISEIEFKFFITNNLLNKVNLFINYTNQNSCCVDYCYYHISEQITKNYIEININGKLYKINHFNSFDSMNRIGFILVNIPGNCYTEKIKYHTKKENISCQLWFVEDKTNNNNNDFEIVQILNIDDAKPKKYKKYNLKKNYEIFEEFYDKIVKYKDSLKYNIENIKEYFTKINSKANNDIKKEISKLIDDEYNMDYNPDSIDYFTYKMYINLSLYHGMNKIITKSVSETEAIENCYKFIKSFLDLIKTLQFNKINLTYHQKIRIINCFSTFNCMYFNESSKRPRRLFIIDDSIFDTNSYKLALNFNKNIINNLTEKSALTPGFLQLDSFILKNYCIKDDDNCSYTLSNEPLIMMKNHLLSSYENFLFIDYENTYDENETKASQNPQNGITIINEKSLFDMNFSEELSGPNFALVISMEFFHEKDSHSKKNLKNLHIKSPIYCIKNNKIVKLNEAEDGRFIESFIGDNKFILELKHSYYQLGELMDIKYFINENFSQLHSKFKDLTAIMNNRIKKMIQNNNENDSIQNKKESNKLKKKWPEKFETVEDFKSAYLFNGNFVYPYSIPFHSFDYGQESEEISDAEKEYLKMYDYHIKKSREAHYDNNKK